jgi:hypothetical protein
MLSNLSDRSTSEWQICMVNMNQCVYLVVISIICRPVCCICWKLFIQLCVWCPFNYKIYRVVLWTKITLIKKIPWDSGSASIKSSVREFCWCSKKGANLWWFLFDIHPLKFVVFSNIQQFWSCCYYILQYYFLESILIGRDTNWWRKFITKNVKSGRGWCYEFFNTTLSIYVHGSLQESSEKRLYQSVGRYYWTCGKIILNAWACYGMEFHPS